MFIRKMQLHSESHPLPERMSDHYTSTDDELFASLKQGDSTAFDVIYNRYHGILFIHAYRLLQDKEEARDVVQDLFAVLWTKAPAIELKSSVAGYLYKAVRNRVLDIIAHRKIQSGYLQSLRKFMDEGAVITDDYVREQELTRMIEDEVKLLPPKMREVFELSRFANMSHKDIAAQLQISDKTVKKQINYAIRALKLKLTCFLLFILVHF